MVHWSSKLGFILALAGSAIGLGNIWRFPYLVAKYGGGAFLLAYLIAVFSIGYFILIAKLACGRYCQNNPLKGISKQQKFKKIRFIFGKSLIGLTLFNLYALNCIYLIVVGWTFFYAGIGFMRCLGHEAILKEDTFLFLSHSFFVQLWCSGVCGCIAFYVLIKGVQKGIEKLCKWVMPLLFLLLIVLSIWMFFDYASKESLFFLFMPNLSGFGFLKTGFDIKIFADAMLTVFGQALYSLSLGFGVIYIYGAYLNKKVDIIKNTKYVVALDTLVSFLASFIIITAAFYFNIEMKEGPALTFISMPFIFNQVHGGTFFQFIFFLLLFLAALTSIISMYEPFVHLLENKLKSRKKACLCVAGLNFLGSLIVLLSFTGLWHTKINLFDLLDKITGSYTLPLVIGLCALYIGKTLFSSVMLELQKGHFKKLNRNMIAYMQVLLKWVIPLIVLLLLVSVLL